MTLEEVRVKIDQIDPRIRELLMERMDYSRMVAESKKEAGDYQIYRADREKEILERLGNPVSLEYKLEYLAVVKKIMEVSRMYQYGLLVDWMPELTQPLLEGIPLYEDGKKVRISVVGRKGPDAVAAILGMIGDYGFTLEKMELVLPGEDGGGEVLYELTILGNLSKPPMKKLIYQLSMESKEFKILENIR